MHATCKAAEWEIRPVLDTKGCVARERTEVLAIEIVVRRYKQ
jgi:hypothetical protein